MLKWTYDVEGAALYVYLSTATIKRQIEYPSGMVVDVDDRGNAVGIEILAPGVVDAMARAADIARLAELNVGEPDRTMITWMALSQLPVRGSSGQIEAPQTAGEPEDGPLRREVLLPA